jgi:hypothetical protein
MPPKPKPTPEKSCLWCEKPFSRKRFGKRGRLEEFTVFQRRKFCSISCAALHQHSKEPPTVAAARKRTRKMRKVSCEACGVGFEMSVHHMDEDPMNNAAGNLQTLCLHCHGFWHAARLRSPRSLPQRMPALFLSQE